MTNVATARPTSVGDVIISAGTIGITATEKFHIKVLRFRPTFSVRLEDSTGDGDKFPFLEHSGHLYMRFVLQGWMLSEFSIGLKQLVSTVPSAQNPITTKMKFRLSVNRSLEVGAILESVTIDWFRSGIHVGVAITGQMHDTDPAGANFEV